MINEILVLSLFMVGALVVFLIGFLALAVLFKITEFLVEKIANYFTKQQEIP